MSAPTDVATFRLTIEYDGTRYAGWQRQPNAPTVQQTIEEALERIVRHPVRCDGAGRTDAGVHALGQVALVRTTAPNVTADSIRRGGNTLLPEDVRILSAEPCASDFDPRRHARLRHYRYSILARPSASALDGRRVLHEPRAIDWQAVEQGLALLEGEHDFSPFRSSACRATRTRLTLVEARHVDDHPLHHLDFRCRSFLHNMIRLMSGLLLEIGMGKHPPGVIAECFERQRRVVSFRTAPAHALVLSRIDYEDAPEEPAGA